MVVAPCVGSVERVGADSLVSLTVVVDITKIENKGRQVEPNLTMPECLS